MKNQSFFLIDDEEKKRKLGTVLRQRTHNAMRLEDVERLMELISIGRQYAVVVHTDANGFRRAEAGRCVKYGRKHIAVAMTAVDYTVDKYYQTIHIYVPEPNGRKAVPHEQRTQTQDCV